MLDQRRLAHPGREVEQHLVPPPRDTLGAIGLLAAQLDVADVGQVAAAREDHRRGALGPLIRHVHGDFRAHRVALQDDGARGDGVDELPHRLGLVGHGDAVLRRRRAAIAGEIDRDGPVPGREMRGLEHPQPVIVRRRVQEDHGQTALSLLHEVKRAGDVSCHHAPARPLRRSLKRIISPRAFRRQSAPNPRTDSSDRTD